MKKNIDKLIAVLCIGSVFSGIGGYSTGMTYAHSLNKTAIIGNTTDKISEKLANHVISNDESVPLATPIKKEADNSDLSNTKILPNNKVAINTKNDTTKTIIVSNIKKSDAPKNNSKTLKDGVYEASAYGYQSDVKVKVKVSKGKIKDVKIVSQKETPEFFEKSKDVISKIIDSQNADVDAVSGATYSSNAIKKAVKKALSDASSSKDKKIKKGKKKNKAQSRKTALINNDNTPLAGPKKKAAKNSKKQAKAKNNKKSRNSKKNSRKIPEINNKQNNQEIKDQPEKKRKNVNVSDIDTSNLTDGTYEGKAQGYNGNISVSVTVKNGKIQNIDILGNTDDAAYFNMAKSVKDNIINSNSVDVDGVTGATFSSDGIKNAVRNALSKAGLKQTPTSIAKSTENIEKLLTRLNERMDKMATDYNNLKSMVSNMANRSNTPSVNTSAIADGTYTGYGMGYKSNVSATVTVRNGRITDITVNSNDDDSYFNNARSVINSIIGNQSTNVDAVSGATYSSNGIKAAVANALASANGNRNTSNNQGNNAEMARQIEVYKRTIEDLKNKLNQANDTISNSSNLNISNSSSSTMPDGDYVGVSNSIINSIKNAKNEVRVSIRGNKITNIALTHRGDDGGAWYNTAKQIFPLAIKYQNIDKMLSDIYTINRLQSEVEHGGKVNFRENMSRLFGAENITDEIINAMNSLDEHAIRQEIAKLYCKKNDVDIDAVSSATMSKTSYLQAIKNAVDRAKAKGENKTVSDVKLISQSVAPKTQYVEGDHLDLSKLKVYLVKMDNSRIEVSYNDFAKNNISCNLENNSILNEHGNKTLVITHNPSGTKIEYNIIVNENIKVIDVKKVKYKLSGEEEKEYTVPSNSNFTIEIPLENNAIGKKIEKLELIDSENNPITSYHIEDDNGDTVALNDYKAIDSKEFELAVKLTNTDEMTRNKKDYHFHDMYVKFKSKTADFSKVQWAQIDKSSTFKGVFYRNYPIDYTGLVINLFDNNNNKIMTVPFEQFSSLGIKITPQAGYPLSYGDSKKSGIAMTLDIEGSKKDIFTYKNIYGLNDDIFNVKIEDKAIVEDTYKDPVVYPVKSIVEERDSNFKKIYNVGDKLDLKGLVVVLLDSNGLHPDNHPNDWDSSTPENKRNHTNIDTLVPTIEGENDGPDGMNNRFDINNITTNLQQGHIMTEEDKNLVITYTSKENNGEPVSLTIPLTINGITSENSSSHTGVSEEHSTTATAERNPNAVKNEDVLSIWEFTDDGEMKKTYKVGEALSFDKLKIKFLDYTSSDGTIIKMKKGSDSDPDNYYIGKNDFYNVGLTSNYSEGTVFNQTGKYELVFDYFGIKSEPIEINVVGKDVELPNVETVKIPDYSIKVLANPKTNYNVNDPLNLSGIAISVLDKSDSNVEFPDSDSYKTVISYQDMEKYHFTTNIQNGTPITENTDLIISWLGQDGNSEPINSEPIHLTVND